MGLVVLGLSGCSVRRMAIRGLGSAFAGASGVYAADDDPELVGDALPFALKTLEALIAEEPRDPRLLNAAASGFTQYAYAFVAQPADFLADQDFTRATEMRRRAVKLYKRAMNYGWRGLEVDFPGLRSALTSEPDRAAERLAGLRFEERHVPSLYWTAASSAAAISLDKTDAELTADTPVVVAMMRRVLELDERFEPAHEFFIAYEAATRRAGGSIAEARRHFERAEALSEGRRVSPYVALAEGVAVAEQDRDQFNRLLEKALAVDVDSLPDERLANTLAQRRARWLLGRVDQLFIE